MGYLAGTPDMLIFEPRGVFYGLFIEIKTKSGTLQPTQRDFLALLDARGYKTYVCHGYQAFVEAVDQYFKENINENSY